MAGQNSPTFSLQLPFILLGSRAVPRDIYTHAERHSKPLEALRYVLTKKCPTLRVSTWIPAPEPVADFAGSELDSRGTLADRKEMKANVWKQREEDWLQSEKRRWGKVEGSGSWVLRRAVTDRDDEEDVRSEIGTWRLGDGCLTAEEVTLLEYRSWWFPVVLQRFDVPLLNRSAALHELCMITAALREAFDGVGNAFFRLVCNERCRVKISVHPGSEGHGVWGEERVEKMLLCLAAFERELTLTDTVTGVSDFYFVSRFLEYRLLRRLRHERDQMWRALPHKDHATVDREERRWAWELQREEETALEAPDVELWEVVDRMREKSGEGGLSELVKQMQRLEQVQGRRMAVGFPHAYSNANVQNGHVGHEDDTSVGEEEKLQMPEQTHEDAIPPVRAFVFQSHRSSLDAEEIIAHIDVVAGLVGFVLENDYATTRLRIESFRHHAAALRDSPYQSLRKLLSLLDVSAGTKRFYSAFLQPGGEFGPEQEHEIARERAMRPYVQIVKSVEEQRRRERSFVETFLKRYEEAGGFRGTSRTKAYRLMVVEGK